MSGPWMKYQGAAQPQAGPWSRYQTEDPARLQSDQFTFGGLAEDMEQHDQGYFRGALLPIRQRLNPETGMREGSYELAWPQALRAPVESAVNLMGYLEGTRDLRAEDALNVAGAVPLRQVAPAFPAMVRPRPVPQGQPAPPPTPRAQDVADMQALGVTPFGPALSGTATGAAVKQLSEVPVAGAPLQRRMSQVVGETRRAAEGIADNYGGLRTAEEGGRAVKGGLERFKDARPDDIVSQSVQAMPDVDLDRLIAQPTRQTSLKTKQAALYEKAWRFVPPAMRDGAEASMRKGRSVKGLPRVLGGVPATMQTIRAITERNLRLVTKAGDEGAVGNPGPGLPVQGGLLGRVIGDIHAGNWQGSLQTMRDLRSELRRLSSGMADTEKNVLKTADIERLQSAITQDMIGLLERNAAVYAKAGASAEAASMRKSIGAFRRADMFTRLSIERLDKLEKVFGAQTPEQVAQLMTRAALDRGRGNLDMLRQARRFLRPEEWDELAGAMVHEMGVPTGSARGIAREQGFSLESFLTRWENMAPEAKALLFRSRRNPGLAQDMERLARVVGRLAEYEALANRSRTATNAIALTAVTGAATGLIHAPVSTIATIAGTRAAATFLASQTYVRWLTRAGQIGAAAGPGSPAWVRHVRRLEALARKDAELGGIVLRAIAVTNGFTQPPSEGNEP